MRSQLQIAPSLLSADFGRLAEEVADAVAAGADAIHVDVMDGSFVPNLTVGPLVVAALRPICPVPLDVHLMTVQPERLVDAFAEAGADAITFHIEATPHAERLLTRVRSLGKKAGIALCPQTSEQCLEYLLHTLDIVLVMTVNPGFGGQPFLPSVLPKIAAVRQLIDHANLTCQLAVDGGIHVETVGAVTTAGADFLVAGAAVFGSSNRRAALARLRERVETAGH